MTGQLLDRLAAHHEVAALYLRAPEESPIAPGLAARLASSEEVARPSLRAGAAIRRNGRRATGWLAGRPLWASDWRVPELGRRVSQVVADWRPDVVQAELLVMGQYLVGLGESRPATVLVEHDPGVAAARDLVAWERGPRRVGRMVDAAAWRRYADRVMSACDAVVTFTDEDAGRLGASARLVRIAPGIELPRTAFDAVGAEPPRVLFLGSFVHPPNVEAAVRLAEAIFPAVLARVPDARLEIVGDAPPPAVRRLASDAVTVTGRVPDVEPHLDGAAVVAAPLRLGGGMRVKVLEALAAGKAVVATRRALAGLEIEPGVHAAVGDSDAELAGELIELLEDPGRRRRMGAAARAWAEDRLDWSHAVAAYDRLYGSLERRS
jgi:glycosyltransferase involved in cell wall biosynthesis